MSRLPGAACAFVSDSLPAGPSFARGGEGARDTMKTEMKRAAAWKRGALLAVGVLPLALLGTGCTSECTDAFDCRNSKGEPPAGQAHVCREQRCELMAVDGEAPETPADAGTDGGSELPSDGGTDAGLDGGSELPSDAGTDAGSDGGVEPPSDGGTDGGTVACADLPHDAKLGTLGLEPGYEATESAEVPEGLAAVTAVPSGRSYRLYALKRSDKSVYALGLWPGAVALGEQPLASVVAPEDRAGDVFLNTYLVNDGARLLAGYTKSGDNAPGSVLVLDTAHPESPSYQPAPGNYTAAGLSSTFLLNGLGFEATANTAAIYALQAGASSVKGSTLATFDPKWRPSSGPTAVTADGVAVLGYFSGEDFFNHLRAVAPAQYGPVLTDGSAPVDLAMAPEIYAQGDLFEIAGFGDGVALHRGTYDPNTFVPITSNVARIPLAVSALDPQVVAVGTLENVLVAKDTCTNVMYLAPLGRDLLVGIVDKNGRRLVRVHQP